MIVTGASAGLALLVPGLPGAVLALVLGQLQMLWDCCDGEVARWRAGSRRPGTFLDKIGHYAAESVIPVCLGIRAAGPDFTWSAPGGYAYAGAMLALLVMFNKALNDMVHVSRAFAGLPRLADVAGRRDTHELRAGRAPPPGRLLAVQPDLPLRRDDDPGVRRGCRRRDRRRGWPSPGSSCWSCWCSPCRQSAGMSWRSCRRPSSERRSDRHRARTDRHWAMTGAAR